MGSFTEMEKPILTKKIIKNMPDSLLKGRRVKSARTLAALSRREIEEKYNISIPTLRSWENPPPGSGGLTLRGAKRFTIALRQAGIICDVRWLLHGIGQGPTISTFDSGLKVEISCN